MHNTAYLFYWWAIGIGIVFCITGIGAIVGVPMIVAAEVSRRDF